MVKGNSACSSIEGFIYTAIDSVGKAAVSFVGQNAGAKKYDRLSKFLKIAYLTSFTLGVALPAIVILLRNPLLALYGVKPAGSGLDKIAYDTGVIRMLVMFVPYFTIAFMQLGSGVLQGLGKAIIASVSSAHRRVPFSCSMDFHGVRRKTYARNHLSFLPDFVGACRAFAFYHDS